MFAPAKNKPPEIQETMTYKEISDTTDALSNYYYDEQDRFTEISRFADAILNMSKELRNLATKSAWKARDIANTLIETKWMAEHKHRYTGIPGATTDILVNVRDVEHTEIIMPLANFSKSFNVDVGSYYGRYDVKYTSTTDKMELCIYQPNLDNTRYKRYSYVFNKELEQLRINDKTAITEISVVEIPDPNRRIYDKMVTDEDFACIAIKTEAHKLHLIYMDEVVSSFLKTGRTRYIGYTCTSAPLDSIKITMSDDFYMAADKLLGFVWQKIIY